MIWLSLITIHIVQLKQQLQKARTLFVCLLLRELLANPPISVQQLSSQSVCQCMPSITLHVLIYNNYIHNYLYHFRKLPTNVSINLVSTCVGS